MSGTSADTGTGSISLTTLGSSSLENFDTLANTAGSTTNTTLPTGWYITEQGGGARDNEQYGVDTGASTTGDIYSYGAAASTERALGALRSGTLIPLLGAKFTNNTGSTITSLAVSYTGEQWRLGTAARTDRIDFQYSLNATDLTTGTYIDVDALDFTAPTTVTIGAKDGNAAANRTSINSTITGLTIPNGSTFFIRWTDLDATGADDGLAVDDFSVIPNSTTPPPNLTINDVSLNEGNAGTTTFTFTVSLSAPAGVGGVTFDIATADGTAQDDNPVTEDNDYVAKVLTSQTIPAGNSTYIFDVIVNGDTSPETNETFFVNVTNVTGATVTDGMGMGVIQNDDAAPDLTINDVTLNEGNAGTTTFTFTVSLSTPAPTGGVTFDIGTQDNSATQPSDYTQKALTNQTIPMGSSTYTFDVLVNGDLTPEGNETFFANVTNVVNAIPMDTQGVGTIINDDLNKIHDVQGSGAATPIPGATVTIEGVVVGNYQGANKLQGFFLQEEDVDADADPATSEGIFVFCITCPTPVAEGQRVRATGTVSEFFNMTEITASTGGSVVVVDAGNHLAEVTPAPIDLPIVGDVNTFYEAREGMLVTFVDTLSVSEYFELARFGQLELFEGGRPTQFTETSAPNPAGFTAHLDNLNRRRVILDDDNNAQNFPLTLPDGSQFVYHPRANGGFSIGTQGTDFFRGGDLVNGLTGVLHWSFAGVGGTDAWRIRPTAAAPATFTVANPRPATPPAVGGAIKAVSMNLLNYFTTIDTTASSSSGPCGPSMTQDCRGADSVAELNRQRERASIVICGLNADVYGLMELENSTATGTITDLLGAVNARCGGAHPYAFVDTGGTLGTDAIRVMIIYRTGVLQPVGSALVDLDPIHNRPPTAQTFDVVDPSNPAFGQRFTVIANHFKSKGCPGTGADADAGDGQSCFNGTRTAQASRLLTWINSTVLPAAGDPDVLLLGDFNSNAKEDPVTTLTSGGFTDLASALLGPSSYSYLFDGQLGHLDYAFASSSLLSKVTGIGNWHINADECDLFDYNDEVKDNPGEAAFEEKPDGSALVPPRVVFQPATPYRASDHDPVIVGLFQISDLAITKVDTPDPVTAGNNLTYTITVTNNGPDAAADASWSDVLPLGTTFVSLSSVAGWTNTTPAVGAGGTVSSSNPSFAVGSAVFTLVVNVDPSVAGGTVLMNTATVTSTTSDGMPGNESGTASTTVAASADLSVTKVDTPDPVTAGNDITYTITVTNAGPSDAASVVLSDTLPVGATYVSHSAPGGWLCTNPSPGSGGTVSCSIATLPPGSAVFTLVVAVGTGVTNGTVITNMATASSATSDPNPGNETGTAMTTVQASADLMVTKSDSPDPVAAGQNLTYTINFTNNGPNPATSVVMTDAVPGNTTFVSTTTPAGWTRTDATAVGGIGTLTFTKATVASGETAVFTIVVNVNLNTADNTILSNSATATSPTPDGNSGNNTGATTTTVLAQADLAVTKTDSPDPVCVNGNITYTINFTNNGAGSGIDTMVTDPVPPNTTFVSALVTSGTGWGITTPPVGGPGNVIFSKPTTASGETATFQMVVKVNAGTAHGTVINNSATATSSIPDPNSGNNTGMATTTVDPTPPTFTSGCPGAINTAAQAVCPFATSGMATFTTPTANDNCPGVTVACVPPSGSMFPVGTTTVTCTATDTAGNTAICSFQVRVFNLCVQDNSNPGNVVLIDTSTGAYRFCCNGVLVASGTGTRNVRGCIVTISDSSNNKIVLITVDGSSMRGTAAVKQGGGIVCTISDSNLANNTCVCQ